MTNDPLLTVVIPALVSILVTSLLSPLLFHFLKVRDDKKKRTFDIRYAEYTRYLRALDQIAAASRTDFEKFMNDTMANHMNAIIAGQGDLARMNQDVSDFTTRIMSSFMQAKGELNALDLVCSDELLAAVHEFVKTQELILGKTSGVLMAVKSGVNNAPVLEEMKQIGTAAEQQKQLILRLMRKELEIGD